MTNDAIDLSKNDRKSHFILYSVCSLLSDVLSLPIKSDLMIPQPPYFRTQNAPKTFGAGFVGMFAALTEGIKVTNIAQHATRRANTVVYFCSHIVTLLF